MAWLAPILVLGLVILVHEAGHFWAAKLFGVYAPRFAIGFGPALWRRRWGETEYVIGVLPLGGYVRMATREDAATSVLEGELDESKGKKEPLDPNAMIPFGPKPVPSDRWFESKPLWQRAIIMLAGVTMNVVLAVVVAASVLTFYGRPYVHPVVNTVVPGMPAERAGLQHGDSIIAVNGVTTATWNDVASAVAANPQREIRLEFVRAGDRASVTLTPDTGTVQDPVTGEPRVVGRIGVWPVDAIGRERLGPIAGLAAGTAATWNMGYSVLRVLKALVTGRIGVSSLGGPVAIARTSVAAARTGLVDLFGLIAFLSINLAILNLVPLPLLDGGQLVLQVAESAKGKPFSDRTREWIARIGLAAILALLLVVTFNDLKALAKSWFG
jgi:regulator of sigma E protease